jgi:hypothetical protein
MSARLLKLRDFKTRNKMSNRQLLFYHQKGREREKKQARVTQQNAFLLLSGDQLVDDILLVSGPWRITLGEPSGRTRLG